MRLVGFDTATDETVAAGWRDGETVFSSSVGRSSNGRPAHATRLLAEVEKAADALGGWGSVDRIAVGTGPGSFTGLRIGLATARALAQALQIELVGVITLEGLARGASARAGDRPVLAAVDARRGELFSAIYGPGGEQLSLPSVDPPATLVEGLSQLPEPPLAVGSGALRFRDELHEGGVEIPTDDDASHRISALQICAIGAVGAPDRPVEPLYLRRPDAERWRERDRNDN